MVVAGQRLEGWWRLSAGAVLELGGGDGADRQCGHDQDEMAQDRGVEAGLAVVQAEAVFAEPEVLFYWPSQPGCPDQAWLGQQLPVGHVAVVKGQFAGAQVTADQQAVTRRAGGDPGPGIPPLALEPVPGERTSQRRASFSSVFTTSAQVILVPAASVSMKLEAIRST